MLGTGAEFDAPGTRHRVLQEVLQDEAVRAEVTTALR